MKKLKEPEIRLEKPSETPYCNPLFGVKGKFDIPHLIQVLSDRGRIERRPCPVQWMLDILYVYTVSIHQ